MFFNTFEGFFSFLWWIHLNATFSLSHDIGKTHTHTKQDMRRWRYIALKSTPVQLPGSLGHLEMLCHMPCSWFYSNSDASMLQERAVSIRGQGASCIQANVWCKVREHAMWKSRWETYLKLCRTTWDRKWDSQLMALLSNPLLGYWHYLSLLSLTTHCVNR